MTHPHHFRGPAATPPEGRSPVEAQANIGSPPSAGKADRPSTMASAAGRPLLDLAPERPADAKRAAAQLAGLDVGSAGPASSPSTRT